MMQTEKWIDEKPVTEITGLSISTLQKDRFYRRGIPYSKIGKSCRYRLADVEAFMEAHRISFQPDQAA